jgi:transcriptional regulator with XRE-family HTH domain
MEDMGEVLSTLAKNIKALRYSSRLSQEDLAERLGVAVQTISAIERGVRKPSLDTLVSLARALDVRVVDLFSEKVEGEAWFVNRFLGRGHDGPSHDTFPDGDTRKD